MECKIFRIPETNNKQSFISAFSICMTGTFNISEYSTNKLENFISKKALYQYLKGEEELTFPKVQKTQLWKWPCKFSSSRKKGLCYKAKQKTKFRKDFSQLSYLKFTHLSKINTQIKKFFSTFAILRPRCIPVGTASIHVCTYHQNVKFTLAAMNSPIDYKQIMELCVCNLENHDCML